MALIQLDFYSQLLKRSVKLNAYIPLDDKLIPGQEPASGPFKTMYLLHGYTGNCYGWLGSDDIDDISRLYGLAVVMPEGENHFYVDAARRGDMYGEYIGREIVEFTRTLFPLSHKREDTIIAGISMGGYGALRNGLKYSGTFGHILGISPANIIHELRDATEEANNVGATRGFYESVFGDLDGAMDTDVNLTYLAEKMKREGTDFPTIYFACGYNDMLVFTNRNFHNVLTSLGGPHIYEEGPGTHDPLFFKPHLISGLETLNIEKPPVPPNPFWIERPADGKAL